MEVSFSRLDTEVLSRRKLKLLWMDETVLAVAEWPFMRQTNREGPVTSEVITGVIRKASDGHCLFP